MEHGLPGILEWSPEWTEGRSDGYLVSVENERSHDAVTDFE